MCPHTRSRWLLHALGHQKVERMEAPPAIKSSQVAQHHRHRPPALGVQCVGRPAAARALGAAQRAYGKDYLNHFMGGRESESAYCDEQLRGTFFPADGSVAVGMSLADFESGCKGDEMRPGRFVRIVGGETLLGDARVHARHCHTRALLPQAQRPCRSSSRHARRPAPARSNPQRQLLTRSACP